MLNIDRDGRGIATLTLDRPEARNALCAALVARLTEALEMATAGSIDGFAMVLSHRDGAVTATHVIPARGAFRLAGAVQWLDTRVRRSVEEA